MSALETIYPLKTYETHDTLEDWLMRANIYGYITRSQGKAILQKLAPMLPVEAAIALRTNKCTIYVLANGARFRVTQRAQIDDKPWNPNPRRPARNPWRD